MSYKFIKIRIRKIKKALKFYFLILILCALAAFFVVSVTDFITMKVPETIELMENQYIRDTVEKATGKKVDDETVKKIKKAYQESEK